MAENTVNNVTENTAAEGTPVPEKTPWYKKVLGGVKKKRHIIGAILAFIVGGIVTFLGMKARDEFCPQLHDGWDDIPDYDPEEEEDENDDEEDEEPPAEE